MSVAMLPLSTEFGYTETIKGQVSSFFSVGYGIGILPVGIALLSVVSLRLMMGVGIARWSNFAHPIRTYNTHHLT